MKSRECLSGKYQARMEIKKCTRCEDSRWNPIAPSCFKIPIRARLLRTLLQVQWECKIKKRLDRWMDQVTDYIQKVKAPAHLWPQFKENVNLAKDYCTVAIKARAGRQNPDSNPQVPSSPLYTY